MASVQFDEILVECKEVKLSYTDHHSFNITIEGSEVFPESKIRQAKVMIVDGSMVFTGVEWRYYSHDMSNIYIEGIYEICTLNKDSKLLRKVQEQRDSAQAAFRNLQKDYHKVLQPVRLLLKLADAAKSLGKQVVMEIYSHNDMRIEIGNTCFCGNDFEQVVRGGIKEWLIGYDTKEILELKEALKGS